MYKNKLFQIFLKLFINKGMSIQGNINKNLDSEFENHALLPQRLAIEDIDKALFEFIKKINDTVGNICGKNTSLTELTKHSLSWLAEIGVFLADDCPVAACADAPEA